jgi:MFS family permease
VSRNAIRKNPTVLFWICCLAFIANGLLSVLPSSSLSILARHTNVSLSTAGMIFTVASLGTIAAIMVSNPFVQRIGAKYVLMAGLAGLITASLVIPTTPVFNLWLVAQFLQGSSSSLINVGLTMILTLNFHEELGEKTQYSVWHLWYRRAACSDLALILVIQYGKCFVSLSTDTPAQWYLPATALYHRVQVKAKSAGERGAR